MCCGTSSPELPASGGSSWGLRREVHGLSLRCLPTPVSRSAPMNSPTSPVVRCRTRDGRWAFDIPEGSTVVLGRDPARAQVVVAYPTLSRQHVRFLNHGGVCAVEYVDARGSIHVNGEPVPPSGCSLRPGDHVQLVSGLVLVVETVSGSSQAEAVRIGIEPTSPTSPKRGSPNVGPLHCPTCGVIMPIGWYCCCLEGGHE